MFFPEGAMIDVEGPEQSLVIAKSIWKGANKWWKEKLLWRVEDLFMDAFFFKFKSNF